jgi:hypothetical protein
MHTFRSESGRFSVFARQDFRVEVNHPRLSPLRGRTFYRFLDQQPGGTLLAVGYADDPHGPPAASEAEALIEAVILFGQADTHPVYDNPIVKRGIVGREARTECCGTAGVFRAFVVGNRFYMVAVSGPANLVDGPEEQLFLDSFTIVGPSEPVLLSYAGRTSRSPWDS